MVEGRKILVCEISGKRPGGTDARPTEKLITKFDHVIITNDCVGYDTEWPIVEVPQDYRAWYEKNYRTAIGNAWLAPMNRSYALEYAREHGYRYVVQCDDNINNINIAYYKKNGGKFRSCLLPNSKYKSPKNEEMFDDIIELYRTVLEHSNAGVVGANMLGSSMPNDQLFSERYCYSFFMNDVNRCIDPYQGDFEDDIEYRLKLRNRGIPMLCCQFVSYGKKSQGMGKKNQDTTGCRADYIKFGLQRGEHMRMIHGDVYTCGMTKNSHAVGKSKYEIEQFKHRIKPFKVGVVTKNWEEVNEFVKAFIRKHDPANRGEKNGAT